MTIRLAGSTSGYTELDSPAVGANNTLTLPSGAPAVAGASMVGDASGNLSFSTALTASSLNDGPLAGFRNRIINGNFDIWQRGTSFSPANGEYTADRWAITYNGSGSTRSITREEFLAGSTVPPGAAYFLKYNQSVAGSGATFNTLNHRIENVRTFGGQTVTLSFYARGFFASLVLPNITLRQNFGAGGSTTVDTNFAVNTFIGGGTYNIYSFVVTVPSITSKVIGTSSFLELIINLPINTTFIFEIAGVQLEPGPVATPFERRPIGIELALCQRYYEVFGPMTMMFPWGSATQTVRSHSSFAVTKRATPTITMGSKTAGSGSAAATSIDTTGTAFAGTGSIQDVLIYTNNIASIEL